MLQKLVFITPNRSGNVERFFFVHFEKNPDFFQKPLDKTKTRAII